MERTLWNRIVSLLLTFSLFTAILLLPASRPVTGEEYADFGALPVTEAYFLEHWNSEGLGHEVQERFGCDALVHVLTE